MLTYNVLDCSVYKELQLFLMSLTLRLYVLFPLVLYILVDGKVGGLGIGSGLRQFSGGVYVGSLCTYSALVIRLLCALLVTLLFVVNRMSWLR
ncbi:hypothetical protein QVD17_07194 [Tagetes erecta]|uniref:Uncharacterized protein n=1 Tax=Tagetes erecta TaxID=13708 RepID=A0AAD8PCT8_TARER|nr:hypothetical protein QVD17_07194 [Tagetes erecta]